MKAKDIIMIGIIIILTALVSILGTYIYFQNNSEEMVIDMSPDNSNALQNKNIQTREAVGNGVAKGSQKNIGGDKDVHGCYLTAGYTWCEAKNKCLREWEEKCETTNITKGDGKTEVDEIKTIVAKKHNKKEKDVIVKITQSDKTHLRGTVKFGAGGVGEEGMFLAVKINGQWRIVYEGSGVANCSELTNVYTFPKSMLGGICY